MHRAGLTRPVVQREFGSRDQLVALMVQRILSAPRTTAPADPVRTLVHLVEAAWRAYRAGQPVDRPGARQHPAPVVPAVLDASRAVIDVFLEPGLDAATALNRYLALSAYIQGMGTLLATEQQEAAQSGRRQSGWWGDELHRFDRSGATLRHPWLAELVEQPPADAFDIDSLFRGGLDRVVHGLTATR